MFNAFHGCVPISGTSGLHSDGAALVKTVLCKKRWHPFFKVIVWLASHVLPYLSLWVGCRL